VSLIERYDAADFDAVARVHASIMELFTATQALGGIVGAKAALQAIGAPGGWPRPPRLPVTSAQAQPLIDLIIALELDRSESL
jgi:dihydrodipicolinate synthase/N-acetylneuraminate lyase